MVSGIEISHDGSATTPSSIAEVQMFSGKSFYHFFLTLIEYSFVT